MSLINSPLSVLLTVVATIQRVSTKNPAAPKIFHITSAYVQAPGMLFPQATELFVGDPTQILVPGEYSVPVKFSIKDNRLAVELDLSAARLVLQKAA